MAAVPRITGEGIPEIDEEQTGFYDPLVAHPGYSEAELRP